MKKSYVKPQIAFESFELAECIAACSNTKVDNIVMLQSDLNSCGFYDGEALGEDFVFFNNSACGTTDGSVGLPCYTIPTLGMGLFWS